MARQSLIPFGLAAREPLVSLHREMNRLFDDVFRDGFGAQQRGLETSTGMPTLLSARMNVSETDKEIRVTVELPGVTEQDIDVSLEDDMLTISGEKREERSSEGQQENYHYIERSYGQFHRSLRLPFSADADQVRAAFQNGVLTVTVPKNERQARTHRIQVQGSSTQGSTAQGSTTQGSTTQGSTTQGSTTQGSTTQGSTTQGAGTSASTAQKSEQRASNNVAAQAGSEAAAHEASPSARH